MGSNGNGMPNRLAQNFLIQAIQRAYTDCYGKRFRHKTDHLKPSHRVLHGIMHAIGCATLVPQVDQLYREHVSDYSDTIGKISAAFQCSEQDLITLVQTVGVFHDAGREADGVDSWDHESALLLENYLLSCHIPANLAKLMRLLIEDKDNPRQFAIDTKIIDELESLDAEYLRHLLNTADTLEVIRVRKVFDCRYLALCSISAEKILNAAELEEKVYELIQTTATKINNEHRDVYTKHSILGFDKQTIQLKQEHHNNDLRQHDEAYLKFLGLSRLNIAFTASLESFGKKIDRLRQRLKNKDIESALQLTLEPNANELQKKFVLASYVYERLANFYDDYVNDPNVSLDEFQENCRTLLDNESRIRIPRAHADNEELEDQDYNINEVLGQQRNAWSFRALIESILKSLELSSGLNLGSRFFKPESAMKLDLIKDSVDKLQKPP